MLESLKNKRIMIVVAHPDDEILGVGGTISLLVKMGSFVKVIILGEGITSRSESRNLKKDLGKLKFHKEDIVLAQTYLGYQELSVHNLPDNRFDTIPLLKIIKLVENEKKIFKPDVIFTHQMGDLNIDHQKTFEAVLTSIRPLKEEKVSALICFETLSGTEWISSGDPRKFSPNFFIELTEEEIIQKVEAMNSYRFEKRPFPHPRSKEGIRNRAQMWGISIGKQFAEAFQIIRTIN